MPGPGQGRSKVRKVSRTRPTKSPGIQFEPSPRITGLHNRPTYPYVSGLNILACSCPSQRFTIHSQYWRMTRDQRGLQDLHGVTLSFTPPHPFIPALQSFCARAGTPQRITVRGTV